jgi:hypothetical protein
MNPACMKFGARRIRLNPLKARSPRSRSIALLGFFGDAVRTEHRLRSPPSIAEITDDKFSMTNFQSF